MVYFQEGVLDSDLNDEAPDVQPSVDGDIDKALINQALGAKMTNYPNTQCQCCSAKCCEWLCVKATVRRSGPGNPRQLSSLFRSAIFYLLFSLIFSFDDIFAIPGLEGPVPWSDLAATVFLAIVVCTMQICLTTVDLTCVCHCSGCRNWCSKSLCLVTCHCLCCCYKPRKPKTGCLRCLCSTRNPKHRAPMPVSAALLTGVAILLAGVVVSVLDIYGQGLPLSAALQVLAFPVSVFLFQTILSKIHLSISQLCSASARQSGVARTCCCCVQTVGVSS